MSEPRATLEHWYEALGFAVHRRCVRLLGTSAEADDALHEVFLRAHKYSRSLKQPDDPLPWLYRIADHYCFDQIAARKRQGTDAQREAALKDLAQSPAPGAAADEIRMVVAVLASLRGEVRDAATLYYVDEMTQDEVAGALSVSRTTVKKYLHHFHRAAAEHFGLRLAVGGET